MSSSLEKAPSNSQPGTEETLDKATTNFQKEDSDADNKTLSSETDGALPRHDAALPQSKPSDSPKDLEDQPTAAKKDPYEVAWDGGDADPLCPRSMNKARKWIIILINCCCSLNVTAASSIYTSTYEQIEGEFHNSREISTLGLSLLVLGISLGPMLLGPMSEFYGRRPIYIISWALYVIWLIPTAVAKNIETILISRFFAGFAGSAFLAVAGGSISDLFSKDQLQAPMALFTLSPFVGPSTGPLIGGFINYNINWRWTWYIWIIFTFALWLGLVFLVPETYHPILLRNKARAIRKETGNENYYAPTEKVGKSVAHALKISLLRPFQLLCFEWMVLFLCLLSAIILGVIYLFFGAFPLVYGKVYGFNLWQSGLTFLGLFFGMIFAAMTDPIWYRIRGKLVKKLEEETGKKGVSEPEFRLPPTIFGAMLCPIGIFIFGWSSFPWVHWIVPVIGSAIFGLGCVLIFTGIFTFLVDAYPLYAASALAANAFVRCIFAAAFPLFGDQMYENLGIQWASSLLGFLMIAMIPFPYIFFKYGKKFRAKSRYAKD